MEDNKKKFNIKRVIDFAKKHKKLTIAILVVLAVAVLSIILAVSSNKELYIEDTTFLLNELQKASDLTTAKLNTTGFSKIKDNGIWLLSRSSFLMTYNATVEAGIDLDKVTVEADNDFKNIIVSIPKAEIQSVKVDSNSIKYYDEEFALFNVDQKEDANRAVVQAEKEAKKQAKNLGILELADSQSETLVKGILANAIPDGYSVVVRRIEE